ncbi:MAG: hypothetical protein J7M26_07235, partial [Armatimonadetes bacterium]|nr:hypothetical protein [Armatimonadota bacterium]
PLHVARASAYAARAEALMTSRRFEKARAVVGAGEAVAVALRSGEAAWRERLRAAVRWRRADPEVLRISMSWPGDERASEAFGWARRLGANELIATWEASPDGLRLWKEQGYRTVMLGNLPVHDAGWLRKHRDDCQVGYWVTPPARAEGDSVLLPVRPTCWGHEHVTLRFPPEDYWVVVDKTTGERVPPKNWDVLHGGRHVHIKPARKGHEYVVYFLEEQTGGDVLSPSFQKGSLASLRQRLLPLKGVLDTYWFDDLGYAYPGPTPQGTWDWESYTFAAHPRNHKLFEKETGVRFDPRWLVLAPYTLASVPPAEYLRWVEWVQAKMKPWLRQATGVPHSLGMKAWLYWGDCHVGIEPYLSSLTAGGIDEIDRPSFEPVAARALAGLADVAPQVKRRFRVDWLFSDRVSDPAWADRLVRRWASARRGLLQACPVGLYWMPFPAVAGIEDEAIRQGLVQSLADISDEFRLLAEETRGERAWRAPLHLVVLNAWGKQYSWRPWGNPLLLHLTALPVDVTFVRLADVDKSGLPADTDVVFVYGQPGTAWSGGRWWDSPKVCAAVEKLVRGGGGLVALEAPSQLPADPPAWALTDLLGVAPVSEAFDVSLATSSRVGQGARAVRGADQASAGPPTVQGLPNSLCLVRGAQDNLASSLLGGLPPCVPKLCGLTAVKVTAPDARLLAYAINSDRQATPGLVVRQVGKGRVAYVAGYCGDRAFTELLRRLVFWAAGQEQNEALLKAEGELVDAYAYPRARVLVVASEATAREEVRLRCAPQVFGLHAQDAVRLRDAVTRRRVFSGTAAELARGIKIEVYGRCARVLRVEKADR